MAMCFLKKPKIILLDNHTAGMNKKEEIMINKCIKQYRKKNNATLITTCLPYNIMEVIKLDNILIVDNGVLVE